MITRSGWIARLVAWMLSIAFATAWVDGPTYISPNVLAGARVQLDAPAKYRNGYEVIRYPNGDIPASWGSCADVSVRALRICGLDLQKAIHEDAQRHPYPGMDHLDTNIDHRRVRNQCVYFARRGWKVERDEFRAGDFVVWKMPSGWDHIGVVSDVRGPSGDLKVIHNGGHVVEQDVLHRWKIAGHYRAKLLPNFQKVIFLKRAI